MTNPLPKPVKKILRIVLIAAGTLAGIVVAAVFLFFLLALVGVDSNPPQVQDLQLGQVTVPSDNNAYFDLIKLKDTQQVTNDLQHTPTYSPWKQAAFDKLINANTDALDLYRQAAQRDYFQDPRLANPSQVCTVVNSNPANLSQWLQVSRVSNLQALNYAHAGKTDVALTVAMLTVNLGHRIQASQTDLIDYLVGVALTNSGLETLQQILDNTPTMADNLLQNIASQLQPLAELNDGLSAGLKLNYLSNDCLINQTITDPNAPNYTTLDSAATTDALTNLLNSNRYFFQPNRTKDLFAADTRSTLAKMPHLLPASAANTQETTDGQNLSLAQFFAPNSMGQSLYNISHVNLDSAISRKQQSDFKILSTATLFALKAYQNDHQQLPVSLADLVPHYLTQVPTNPTGEMLGYDAAKKTLSITAASQVQQPESSPISSPLNATETVKINF